VLELANALFKLWPSSSIDRSDDIKPSLSERRSDTGRESLREAPRRTGELDSPWVVSHRVAPDVPTKGAG